MNLIFDTHAHYDDHAFSEDREELLSGLFQEQVGTVVNVCANFAEISQTLELAAKYPHVYAAVGVHPTEVYELKAEAMEQIESYARSSEKVVAIGEIGLDYHYPDTQKEAQKDWFVRQIDLAKRLCKPIIVHTRDAAKDTLDIIKAEHAQEAGGVIHCFPYETEMAKIYLELGFYLGIGGVVTFKNARKVKEVVEMMPLDRLLLETDCPYLAPTPFRGKRNDSRLLTYAAEEIARIKNMGADEVIRITAENARRFYRIEE